MADNMLCCSMTDTRRDVQSRTYTAVIVLGLTPGSHLLALSSTQVL